MSEPVRARDASVDKLYRARCNRPECCWMGSEHATYAGANAERQGHLRRHSLEQEDGDG